MSAAAAAAPAPALKEAELTTEQEIVDEFNAKRRDQSAIMARIAEFEADAHEHNLVLEALKGLEPERRCHRLVGGALIERTVGEVRPEVEQALKNYQDALGMMNAQLLAKEKELETFMLKYKISIKGKDGQPVKPGESAQRSNAGVLA
jgi:prefoldin subunit 2